MSNICNFLFGSVNKCENVLTNFLDQLGDKSKISSEIEDS